jgi:hypothetical protein
MNAELDEATWARVNQVCFQVGPFVEMRGKEKVQVGFTLDLYAALPTDKAAGTERREESQRIWERMRGVVESIVPEGAKARVEIEPRQTAAFFRPENEMHPEIALRARIVHGEEYWKAVTADERARLGDVERNLTARGLRSGHW